MAPKLLIALLVAVNIALGAFLSHRIANVDHHAVTVLADHVQGVRVEVQKGDEIYVSLGVSATPSGLVVRDPTHTATLVLRPRAAIQLEHELRQMIELIKRAADAQVLKDRPEATRSPDRSI